MKSLAVAVVILTVSGLASEAEAQSRPGGCLKYGLGGAIAGHFAGGHRVKGALAGCAIGVLERRRHEQALRERNRGQERRVPAPRQGPPRTAPPEDMTVERIPRTPRTAPAEDVIVERTPRAPRPAPRESSPYEDLGIERTSPPQSQANRLPPQRPRPAPRSDGFEQGGTFSRQQPGSEPDFTGSLWPQTGTTY